MEEYPVCDIRDCPGYGTAHQPLYATPNFVADALDKLTSAGWEASMGLYDVLLSHPYIDSEADARGRIEDLGLDPEHFHFPEWEDDENE